MTFEKNNVYIFPVITLLLVVCAFGRPRPHAATPMMETTVSDSAKIDTVIRRAYSVMGTPYKWAGASPQTGFDCSGFVYWCFKPTGIVIPRSSAGLYNVGEKTEMDQAQRGDIILFRGTNANDKSVGHVGIVVSKAGEPLKFVHSSSSKQHWGVIETEYGKSYYTRRYVGIRRLFFTGK